MSKRYKWVKSEDPVLCEEFWEVINLVPGDRLEVYKYQLDGKWHVTYCTIVGGTATGCYPNLKSAKAGARRLYLGAYKRILAHTRKVLALSSSG